MFFSITADNNVTTHDVAPEAQEGTIVFASQKELAAATAEWPTSRYVEVWNAFAGTPGAFARLKEIKKFTDRATAVQRIWNVLHILSSDPAQDIKDLQAYADGKKTAKAVPAEATAPAPAPAKKNAPKTKNGAKKAEARKAAKKLAKTAAEPREGSKKATVIAMLERKGGATLAEIAKTMGWENHTVRGFISGTLGKRMGLSVESFKNDSGERAYKLGK
jgi:hypothetical protein